MGKGSSTAPQEQVITSTTSNLPAYAQPFYTDLMQRAQAGLSQQYTPYGQERIAGFTPEQQQVRSNVLGQQSPGQFGAATQLAAMAGQGSLAAGQYDPAQFYANQVGGPNLQQYSMTGPDAFGVQQAGQYMSPYMQQVVDVQKREATRDAQQGQLVQDLGAARQGTYGGSRQLLAGLERERNLGQQLGDIQATGSQAAFQQAQQQFNEEQRLRQQAGQNNLQAALGVQELGTQSGLQALLANQQYGLEAQRLGEQSRQFGSTQGLAGLQQAGQMAQTLGNIGQMQSQSDLSRLTMQQQTAAQSQALQQQGLDTAYADFLRQQGYPAEQLQQYSSLLQGVPRAVNQTQTASSYTQPPSLASQIMGTGLGALGAYQSLTGG